MVLSNKFIILWYFIIILLSNLNSSIICCLFSWDIYFSFGIFISFSSVFECHSFECNSFEWNSFEDFEILVIFSAILLPIKSPVDSVDFLNWSFWSSFYCICFRFFSTIKTVLTILIAHALSNFSCMFINIIRKW